MPDPDPEQRAKLTEALKRFDDEQREARVDRIVWMAAHNHRPNLILGNPETLQNLQEAAAAYREGQFVSVILLALAVIEHELVEELVDRRLAGFDASLVEAIRHARKHQVLDGALLDRVDKLRLIRNPFAHRKPPEHPHTYGNRYTARRMHPKKLLEEDAQEAFQVMHLVFRALLKPMPPTGPG
jgi:hypothetical protein